MALTHAVYLESIYEYIRKGGGSRGSYLVVDPEGLVVHESLDPEWKIKMGSDAATENKIQEINVDPDFACHKNWVEPRPIPTEKHWFETLWKQYRDNKSIT